MRGDFLDFTKEQKLSEDECELITYYRMLSKSEKQSFLKLAYQLISEKINNKLDNK